MQPIPQTARGVKTTSGTLHPLGLLPTAPLQPASAAIVLQEILAQRALMEGVPAGATLPAGPPACDNSAGLPPVGDQGAQGSCVSWAIGYYLKSYQEAKEHGWSLADSAHRFSPAFLYNQLQSFDEGSTFPDNLDLLTGQGCATLATAPYNDADHLTWPPAAAYREAIPFRAASYHYLGHGETAQVFEAVKAILASGDVCVVGFPVFRPNPAAAGRFDQLSAGDNEYDLPPASDGCLAGYHAVAIVGYDESKFGGTGGYKIVNSWSDSWGDGGFAWLSQRFLATYGFDFHRMTDRLGYVPTGMVHFKVSHAYWWYDNVIVTVGVGPVSTPVWSKALNKRLNRDGLTMDRWADITEAAEYLPPDWTNRWWIKVEDHSYEDAANLAIAEIEAGGAAQSANLVLPLDGPYFGGDLVAYIPAGEAASSDYYVNDDTVALGDICTAPGDDANDGLTPATPRRNVQAIIDRYTLKAGDTVWIDAGTYDLAADVSINYLDRGQAGNPIRFVGALKPNGEHATILRRTGTTGAAFSVGAGWFVQLENLWLTGGQYGVYSDGTWTYWEGDEVLVLQNLRISGTSAEACYLYEAQGVHLRHCRLHGFAGSYGLGLRRSSATLDHCVIAAPANKGCAWLNSSSSNYASNAYLALKNSILTASGSSGRCISLGSYSYVSAAQYNDVFVAEGAAIGFTPDATNVTTDPLFAGPAGGDFHLQSTAGRWDPSANSGQGAWAADTADSPCIDAGDFAGDCSREPVPNGGRVNIGAYGGTIYASKSAAARRWLFLDTPTAGTTYQSSCPIAWRVNGVWQPGDTLLAEYSADGGLAWTPIPGAEALPYAALAYQWDTSNLVAGTNYLVRLSGSGVTAVSGVFSLDPPVVIPPTCYYVNDGSIADDVYCTAAGDDANDGLTPAAPKATVQAILDTYDLEPGNTVYVDTGHYALSMNLLIAGNDSGSALSYVTICGSTRSSGTVLDRQSTADGARVVQLDDTATFVRLKNLCLTGGQDGVYISSHGGQYEILGCVIHGNGRCGIYSPDDHYNWSTPTIAIRASWIYNNTSGGVAIATRGNASTVEGCTFYGNGGTSLAGPRVARRNIVYTAGSGRTCVGIRSDGYQGDWNDLVATEGAVVSSYGSLLSHLRAATGQDSHSMSADPLFADAPAGDFHLKSTGGRWDTAANGGAGGWVSDAVDSPCIDAGDPADSVGAEPAPNGNRINLGAYGGTAEASRTPAGRTLTILGPNGADILIGTKDILWLATGQGWKPGDTVRLEWSADGGLTWAPIAGASALPHSSGTFAWDTTAVGSGVRCRVRAVCDQDQTVQDGSDSNFTIHNTSLAYYVNDGSTADDAYCTAVGDDANDGLTPATPKATVQAILDTYDLEPGDTVYVDTGYYALASNLLIAGNDSGSASAYVTICGSTRSSGTVLDRQSTASGARAIQLDDPATCVRLKNLCLTGGQDGVYISSHSLQYDVVSCAIYGNGRYGIYSPDDHYNWSIPTIAIRASRICNNASGGVTITSRGSLCTVEGCTFYGNGGTSLAGPAVARRNIVCANGSGRTCIATNYYTGYQGDWNDLVVTDGAVVSSYGSLLSHWSAKTGQDSHSLSADPLFANAAGSDFHLKSTGGRWDPAANGGAGAWIADAVDSPCIDAGDPADSVGAEPAPNGNRINLGAYGGTAEASKARVGRMLTIQSPNGGETWSGTKNVLWLLVGQGWDTGDTIRLEWSTDGGATWTAMAGAAALPCSPGTFAWDTAAVPSGVKSRVRAICNQDETVRDESDANFTIHNTGLAYYVNDASTTGDIYCTGIGDDANDGLTPATSKATVQAIIDTYDLEPGDVVYIDTGTYTLAANIKVTSADSGSSQGQVTFEASPRGVTISRGSTASYQCAWELNGCSYVTVRTGTSAPACWMKLTGGDFGAYVRSAGNCVLERLEIFASARQAICAEYSPNVTYRHNLLRNNSGAGITLYDCDSNVVESNTIAGNADHALNINYSSSPCTVRNNILWGRSAGKNAVYWYSSAYALTSDYNLLYATEWASISNLGATLADWQTAAGKDLHSLSADPSFVDAVGNDYHLQSTAGSWHGGAWTPDAQDSPCIDAGDLADAVGAEPAPNGGRINLGAYGGTEQASKSHVTRQLTLLAPNGGETLRTSGTVRWVGWGGGWSGGDTVDLYYSSDGQGTWHPVPGGSGLPFGQGQFEWNTIGLAAGSQYYVKVDSATGAVDVSDGPFTIGGVYYVNDVSQVNDVYCSAVGDDANDGLSGQAPKASITAVLSAYDLGPGDVILVDTGVYLLASDIVVPAEDGGSSASYVRMVGSSHPDGSVLDRQVPAASSGVCINLSADYVAVERFVMRNAQTGILIPGGTHRYGHRMTGNRMFGCGILGYLAHSGDIRGNVCRSIALGAGSSNSAGPWTIAGNVVVGGGIAFTGESNYGSTIRNNIVYAIGSGQFCIYAYNPAAVAASNYNDLIAADGAKTGRFYTTDLQTLVDWRRTGWDLNSLSVDPRFADPAAGDYHLKSTEGRWDPATNTGAGGWVTDEVISPCIDAGDPADNAGNEPSPNGGRINIGAYGGSPKASKSPASGRWLVFEGAGNRQPLHASEPLRWSARGVNWAPGETVRLEVSADSGTTWQPIAGAEVLACEAGFYWWDTRDVVDGTHYRFRVVANGGLPLSASDESDYAIANLAWSSSPADGAIGLLATRRLCWAAPIGATSYDVYIWKTSQPKPTVPTAAGLAEPFLSVINPPWTLDLSTAYKWQVVAHDSQGQAVSPEWSFTTSGFLAGDVNEDGAVDSLDLLYLVDAFGSEQGDANYDPDCDVDGDGLVDVLDLLTLVYNFGS